GRPRRRTPWAGRRARRSPDGAAAPTRTGRRPPVAGASLLLLLATGGEHALGDAFAVPVEQVDPPLAGRDRLVGPLPGHQRVEALHGDRRDPAGRLAERAAHPGAALVVQRAPRGR